MTEVKPPKSCWDCKFSAFGKEILCTVENCKELDLYDYDKSISPDCPMGWNKKEGDTK